MPKISARPASSAAKQLCLDDSPWEQKLVRIPGANGASIKVEASVIGTLAVHVHIAHSDRYTVTHLPTGCSIIHVSVESDGMLIAEDLWNNCCLAFRQETKEGVLAKSPPWIKTWLDRIVAAQGYVPIKKE